MIAFRTRGLALAAAALGSPLWVSCTDTSTTELAASARSIPSPVGGAVLRSKLTSAPQIINVSHYDPKERQRRGSAYSASDLSALKRNGARALIARCGKGRTIDEKCGQFLAAAERQGFLLGAYFFVLDGVDPVWQADRFVNRMRSIKSSYRLQTDEILMVGDFDSKSSVSDILRFIDRIEKRTGKLPMVYLENSPALRSNLARASSSQRRRIAQCPYWLALYSHNKSGMETPARLMRQYGVWDRWVMWQYGGVHWDRRRGRSQPLHYNHGPWRSPTYFGDLDRPVERSAFNGSTAQLYSFWSRQSWNW